MQSVIFFLNLMCHVAHSYWLCHMT